MTIPSGFAQITHEFVGESLPHGAAVVYGVANALDQTAILVAGDCHNRFTPIMAQLSAGVTLQLTRAKLGPDDTGPSAEVVDPEPGAVAVASGIAPNVAYLATKTTELGGRRGKGRMFIPGASETVVDGTGTITTAFQDTLQGLLNDFLAGLETDGVPMVLLHGPATEWVLVDGQPRRVPVAGSVPGPSGVTALTLSGTVATQRRRLR